MIKIAIVGSRSYKFQEQFNILLSRELDRLHIERWQLISGGAKGIDTMAEIFYSRCLSKSLPSIIIRPDYCNLNYNPKIAPLIRNREIARQCDLMIAFWDGLSGGTANAISWATFYGKTVIIFEV